MKSWKANNKNELYYIFVYIAILIVGVALTKKPMTALYAGGIFIPLAMIYILFYIMEKLGVKRKFTGYMMKDAQV